MKAQLAVKMRRSLPTAACATDRRCARHKSSSSEPPSEHFVFATYLDHVVRASAQRFSDWSNKKQPETQNPRVDAPEPKVNAQARERMYTIRRVPDLRRCHKTRRNVGRNAFTVGNPCFGTNYQELV